MLRRLPAAELKVDRSFIIDIDEKPEAFRFLQSMVAMGTECKMDILAEGVETTPQLEKARQAGCGAMQGFYLARPMPAEDFPGWLAERKK